MSTKKQRRSEDFKDRQKKKSTRIVYLAAIIAGVVIVLGIFFVMLFSALFPPVDVEAMKKKEKKPFNVYFSDSQERLLVGEIRYLYKDEDPAQQAREIVKALLDGSKVTGHVNTFPPNVKLLDIKVDKDGIAYVNFSANLTKLHPGGSAAEMATIYSLTNSLAASIPAVRGVKILVEGKEVPSIKGHISTAKVFEADRDLFAPIKTESN